jgi:hypothetical protein
MANVMTPCFSQSVFFDEWRKQVGFSRKDGCPYSHIMTMNSGSESVELSARLTDVHAKLMTDPGAVHAGKAVDGFRTLVSCVELPLYGGLLRDFRPQERHDCA